MSASSYSEKYALSMPQLNASVPRKALCLAANTRGLSPVGVGVVPVILTTGVAVSGSVFAA
ncbi:hypothetical protein SAMN05216320_110187 [Duganella sp. OV458]|nr:hypothetical protein SAMN05216320_110187 [Duganella sp. OV458]SDK32882.1 hypothetical protein SAMN05428973_110188 [Duganella sp. OV510]